MMKIMVNAGDVQTSDAILAHAEQEVADALHHLDTHVTRVEVHLRDTNSGKSGWDKHCTMEFRLAGRQPQAVHAEHNDLYQAITEAAGKLRRRVQREHDRMHEIQRSA